MTFHCSTRHASGLHHSLIACMFTHGNLPLAQPLSRCVAGESAKAREIRNLQTRQHVKFFSSKSNMPTTAEDSVISNSPTKGPPAKIPRIENPTDVILKFAKLSDQASAPTRGSKQAAGYDLYSAYEYAIPPQGKVLAKTDIQIAVPDGCYGRVAPRSGLAHKHFIDVGAGVIDQDYRGNVGVILFNFGKEEFKVNKGDRIAQLIMERIHLPVLEECETLDETERGSGGFGSTGKN